MPNPNGMGSFLASLFNQAGGERPGRFEVISAHPGYPTQEEIMNDPPTHKPAVISLVRDWKKNVWREAKTGEPQARYLALESLVKRLASEGYQRPVEVAFVADAPSCYYMPTQNRIVINSSLSIISSLHELAHHLFGPSETQACRWSVHLFRKAFPRAFERLEVRGHTLVKRQTNV